MDAAYRTILAQDTMRFALSGAVGHNQWCEIVEVVANISCEAHIGTPWPDPGVNLKGPYDGSPPPPTVSSPQSCPGLFCSSVATLPLPVMI